MDADWRRAFDLGDGAEAPEPEGGDDSEGVFKRLRQGLSRSRQALGAELGASLTDRVDEQTWEGLEEALILADVGAPTTAAVVRRLEDEAEAGKVGGGEAAARAPDRAAGRDGQPGGGRPHRPQQPARGDHGRRRQRHRQDDHDRQDRLAPAAGAGPRRDRRRRRHLPRRRGRAADRVGRARRLRDRQGDRGWRPRRRRLRRGRGRAGAGRRRRHLRHRRAPAHQGQPDGGAVQGPPRDRRNSSTAPRTRPWS